jgi:predicted metal-dependent phosphoesterase TrpH
VIDLHTHTTASDGRCTPEELVSRASRAGVTVLGLTDHDTVAGTGPAAAACAGAGIEFVPGIEVTAIAGGLDVHVLGYFIDAASTSLESFLSDQRQRRLDRVQRIVERLAAHGILLDADAIVAPAVANPSIAAGRPWIARALIAGGHVADTGEAFEKWLATGRAAFVPRMGARPEEVFARVHEAGGIASLAHPALVAHDDWIPGFAAAGLDALEAYHPDHDEDATLRYLGIADRLGLAVSGGSDFHGDDGLHGAGGPGSVALPRDRFDHLKALGGR